MKIKTTVKIFQAGETAQLARNLSKICHPMNFKTSVKCKCIWKYQQKDHYLTLAFRKQHFVRTTIVILSRSNVGSSYGPVGPYVNYNFRMIDAGSRESLMDLERRRRESTTSSVYGPDTGRMESGRLESGRDGSSAKGTKGRWVFCVANCILLTCHSQSY